MAAVETPTQRGEAWRKEGKRWLDRITAAEKTEKDWLDAAARASQAYTGETGKDSEASLLGTSYDFNILYSNVETIVPAIINSPPAPDIRRRFADDDPAAKDVAELIERAIRVQIDDSRLQTELESEAQDAFLAGRGVIRLRFKSDFVTDPVDEIEDAAEAKDAAEDAGEGATEPAETSGTIPPPPQTERLANERITFEAVSWRDYRHGPAKRWDERPWEAFRFCIERDDEAATFDAGMISEQASPTEGQARSDKKDDLTGWEIWNARDRKVYFVDDDGFLLKTVDDPLGWSGFYPSATPMQPISLTGKLTPVTPFSIYTKLADELDLTTKRIKVITEHMKVKGWYPGDAGDIANMVGALDAEFVPIQNAEIWAANGGLAGAVAFWPVEKFIVVLRELYVAREQTKQAIYEITGISDIVRGASKADETLGAQQIKTQWGSLRIQKMQRMLERTARDLFVMMAEIIPAKFSPETLQAMTGIQIIPTQQDMVTAPNPQAEQARLAKLAKMQSIDRLLKQKLSTMYRIDVESDSTVRADLTRQKAESAEFLQGAAAYFAAVGPLVQQGAIPMDAAVEIFAANARLFNLGKSVEDTLEKMLVDARQKAAQPPQPSPEQQKAEAEAKAREQDAALRQREFEMKDAAEARKVQREDAAAQRQIGFEQQKAEIDLRKAGVELQIKQIDLVLKKEEAELGLRTKAAESAMKLKAQRDSADIKAQNGRARQ